MALKTRMSLILLIISHFKEITLKLVESCDLTC